MATEPTTPHDSGERAGGELTPVDLDKEPPLLDPIVLRPFHIAKMERLFLKGALVAYAVIIILAFVIVALGLAGPRELAPLVLVLLAPSGLVMFVTKLNDERRKNHRD